MTRWKLTLEYDGRAFCGWQRQENALAAQQVLEEAVYKFCGETVTSHVAGRTDSGVHALAQVAHVDILRDTNENEIIGALNFHTRPHPISVISAEPMTDEFHARFNAIERRYVYYVRNRKAPLTFDIGRQWHVVAPLDEQAMQQAANLLLGKHDFSTFRAAFCQASSPLRSLDEARVVREGDVIAFHFRARSFLYHQVRNMVGTLVQVGSGKWSVDEFRAAFEAKDRTKGGPTAPADGLYFAGVSY